MKKNLYPQYICSGDNSILVKFGEEISPKINSNVVSLASYLRNNQIPEILDILPSYSTVLITFNSLLISHYLFEKKIKEIVKIKLKKNKVFDQKILKIPVLYSEEFGLDLDRISNHTGLNISEIIKLHTSKEYIVYSMGFTPGFPYLADLDKKLDMPRLKKPRLKVPQGSVAITGAQTGIYPFESGGGWNIIGRTPLELFDSSLEPPSRLKPGDKVKFFQIASIDEFDQISKIEKNK
tara:strand:- start:305 stop:1015 length:711 start_codon:yes stop_codon:yes gene_type:complete